MKVIINSFKNWKTFDYCLLIGGLLVLTCIAILNKGENWQMTLIASFASITAGVLIYKGQQLGFAIYIVYSILYAMVSLRSDMYGEAILYGVYALPMYVMSTTNWIKEFKTQEVYVHEEFLEIQKLDKKHAFIILGLAIVVTIGYGYLLSQLGSAVPYLNSLGTVCSATAIYMTNKKYKEQWWAWLSYSFVFAAIWMSNMTITFAVQSAVFVILNLCGLITWQRKYKEQLKEG